MHQLEGYDRELGISRCTKNYRTGYPYYDPVSTLGEAGQKWWSAQS